MISLRHHVVSIAAVFLALALGVVLGSTSLAEGLLSGLRSDNASLSETNTDLASDNNALRSDVDNADGFDTAIAPLALQGVLERRSVVLITTPDADPADRDALVELLPQAGATLAGQLALTDDFLDPANTDQLRTTVTNVVPAGVELPTGAVDAGSLAGSLLGSVLLVDKDTAKPQSTPAELASAVQALQAAGYLGQGAADPSPAQVAVVLTGGAQTGDAAGDRAAAVARFAAALDRAGAGAVLTGRAGSAEGDGPVGVARADNDITSALSTVDNVATAAGQITTVLALGEQLDGRAGRYGTAGSAQGITVDPRTGG